MRPADVDLGRLTQFLRRRARWIIGAVLAALTLALVYYVVAPPRYRAVAELLIDPRGITASKADASAQTLGADSNLLDLETQRYLILSKSVLGAVVDDEGLTTDRRFLSPGLFSRLLRLWRAPGDLREAALTKLADSVEVVRGERALILDIVVTTSDPELSARIANAVSRAFFTQQANARNEAARRASQALQGRAEQLARQVQEAEAKVERYKSEHDLSGFEGKLTGEQQLGDINYQLGLARAQTATQRARYEEALSLTRSRAQADRLSEASSSPVLIGLRTQYANLVQRKATLETQFGPQHPALIDVNRQLRDVGGLIRAELSRVVGAALSDYRRAEAKEAALEKTLSELKEKYFHLNDAVVGLRALERSVEATRALYQSSLTRAKELEETQEVDSSTSRIISEAAPSLKRSGPPLSLILAGALLCGLGLGSALGYARDLMAREAPTRADVEDAIGLPIIAQAAMRGARGARGLFRREVEAGDLAQSTEQLLDWIMQTPPAQGPRIVLISGLDSDARKSTLLFELAAAAFAKGARTLLVDGDRNERAPSQLWRAAAARLAPAETASGAVLNEFDDGFALEDDDGAGIEAVCLADMLDTPSGAPTMRDLWRALRDYAEDADIVLLGAGAGAELAKPYNELADALLVLVDSARLDAQALTDVSDSLDDAAPMAAGAMLIGDRKVA